ncbi:MAG: C39 family peptidase [Cyanobacteria bacterium J06558_2]
MIDDILNSFNGWFHDEHNSENILLVENLDIDVNLETESISSISTDLNENPIDTLDVATENTFNEELSSLNVVDSVQNLFDWFVPDSQWDMEEFDGWGNPQKDAVFWQQQEGSSSCAIVAQTNVYESITGHRISEEEACKIAQQNDWFDPDLGTHPSDIGKLLNEFGIPTEQKYDAQLEDIANALEKEDRVIVGLDANEIWYPLRDASGNPIEQTNAGHAVWITGIDTQADGSVKIILNDSGSPDGQMAVVDAVDFLNAWEDFGNFVVVADASKQTILA